MRNYGAFKRTDTEASSTLICAAGHDFTWSGQSDELDAWMAAHEKCGSAESNNKSVTHVIVASGPNTVLLSNIPSVQLDGVFVADVSRALHLILDAMRDMPFYGDCTITIKAGK